MACMDAIWRDSTDVDAYNGLAVGLAQLGRYEEALDAWRQYARWRPDDYSVHYNMGFMLELLHRFADSRSSFERALMLAREVRDAQTVAWHIGTVTWRLGGTEVALRWFREAAALDSTDASAWGRAAMMAVQLGRPAEAIGYWRRALQAEPGYFEGVNRGDRALYTRALMEAGNQPLAPVQRMHLVRIPPIEP